jgi:uncharacterized membrane protein (DUF485 family)
MDIDEPKIWMAGFNHLLTTTDEASSTRDQWSGSAANLTPGGSTMITGNPYRRIILGMSLFFLLVVAFDVIVLVLRPTQLEALPAAVIGAALALVGLVTIVALVITGGRYNQYTHRILAGDYLVRWHYTQGEWQQFVMQERIRSIRAALIFLPLTLVFVVLIVLLSRVLDVPISTTGILFLLLIAAAFLVGFVYTLVARRAFERRAHLTGDTYLSQLGILRPDGYRPLHGVLYHLAAVDVLPGRPCHLRFRLKLGRVGNLLALIGNTPAYIEERVPVPFGHEAEATQVADRLLRRNS